MMHQALFDLRKLRKQVLPLSVGWAGLGGFTLHLLTDHNMPYFVCMRSLQTDGNILLGNIVRYYYIGNIQPLTTVNIFKFYLFRKIRTLKVARLEIYIKSGDPWKSFRWNTRDYYYIYCFPCPGHRGGTVESLQ